MHVWISSPIEALICFLFCTKYNNRNEWTVETFQSIGRIRNNKSLRVLFEYPIIIAFMQYVTWHTIRYATLYITRYSIIFIRKFETSNLRIFKHYERYNRLSSNLFKALQQSSCVRCRVPLWKFVFIPQSLHVHFAPWFALLNLRY